MVKIKEIGNYSFEYRGEPMKELKKNNLFIFLTIILVSIHFIDFSIYRSEITHQLKLIIPVLIIMEWLLKIKFRVKFKSPSIYLAILIYFLIISIIISMLNTDLLLNATMQGFSLIVLLLIAFVVVPDYISTEEDYIYFLKVYLITFLILMTFNIIWGQLNSESIYTIYNNRIRYRAAFENPNSLGLFSLVGVMLSSTLFFLLKNKYYLLISAFYLIIIVHSDSNTSLITAVYFATIVLLLSGIKNNKSIIQHLSYLTVFATLTLTLIGVVWVTFSSNNSMFSQLDQLLNNRINRSVVSLTSFSSIDFILGRGLGSRITNPHNAFINILVELGIFGVISIYGIKLLIFFNAFKAFKKHENYFIQKVMIINMSMMSTFIILGFSESVSITLGNILSIFMWSSFGIHMKLIRNYKKSLL